MINLMIIYNVVNIFSMKNHKSSRKLRVGVNWYPGVNWSTTTSIYFICYTFSEVIYQNPEYRNTSVNMFFLTKHVYSTSLLSLEVKVTNWKVSGGTQLTSHKYHL